MTNRGVGHLPPACFALKGIIHGTGAVVAVLAGATTGVSLVVLVMSLFQAASSPLIWVGLAAVTFIFALVAMDGWQMMRKLNPRTVDAFAVVISLVCAYVLYNLLPWIVPGSANGVMALHGAPLVPAQTPEITYRAILAFAVFMFLRRALRVCLVRILQLDRSPALAA